MKLAFPAILFILLWIPAGAQQIIVNSNGDRIVMYPDGSWRTAEAGDSILLRNLQKSEPVGYLSDSDIPSRELNPGEYEDYILRQWNELHFNILAQEKKIQGEFRAATNAQFKAKELLENAEANKSMIEPDRFALLKDNYDKSVTSLKKAKLNLGNIHKILDKSKKLADMDPMKIEKKLNPLRYQFNDFLSDYNPSKVVPVPGKTKKSSEPKSSRPEVVHTSSTKSNSAYPVNSILDRSFKPYHSEPFECKVYTDTVDEATGRRRIVLAPELIFTHTDPDLRPYFKNKELITCYGQLTKIDAYVYLTIDFQIASSHSQSNFGSLQQGSLLRLRLLNGEFVTLHNLKSDKGRIDPYSGHTVFSGQYAMGKDEIKLLTDNELDKVRILWSTGYEDYDVYKIDFFKNQLTCLMSR